MIARLGIPQILLVLFLICVALLWFDMTATKASVQKADDRSAARAAALLIVDYMKTHQEHWPSQWQDLEESFQQTRFSVNATSLSELENRVQVDWSIDPESLRRAALTRGPMVVQVIKLRAKTSELEAKNANGMIYDHLIRLPETGTRPASQGGLSGKNFIE